MRLLHPRISILALTVAAATALGGTCDKPPLNDRPGVGSQLFTSPQVNPVALSCDGALVYVANTTSGTLSVLETGGSNTLMAEIHVGMDPVGVAVRPKVSCADVNEDEQIFVTNHVSDSIAVVSRSVLAVVQTIQQLDAGGVSETDEPVGVAFAGSNQAFVTLDHPNQIVKLTPDGGGQWQIAASTPIVPAGSTNPPADGFTAQAPRALTVSNGRLYVTAFESGNQSEFPSCGDGDAADYDPNGNGGEGTGCEFPLNFNNLLDFATNPNIGGEVVHNPAIPDRDLFVYDLNLNKIGTVQGVGTLLYGVAAIGDTVYVTNTEARNKNDGLDALEGRMFENRLAILACGAGGCSLTANLDLDLNGLGVPVPTPYGIAASADGQTLVASVAGSDGVPADLGDASTVDVDIPGLITLDAAGNVLGHVQTGAIPQGVALLSDAGGAAAKAFVLNTVDSTLSIVDVSTPAAPTVLDTIPVGSDPTPPVVKRGRIQFSSARASTSGTFSCESCHPNGNIDQIDWTINTALGPQDNCSGNDVCPEPRSTMPVRGLRDTLPLHWAGNLADPFAGTGVGAPEDPVAPDCDLATDGEVGCIRHLVDASLSSVMCEPSSCPTGPNAQPGALDDTERDDMAVFLAAVAFPPSPERRPDDVLSSTALAGVDDFFTDQGGLGQTIGQASTCANSPGGCHTLPLTVATNSPVVGGFDAPTIRGLWDRHITFSNGITSTERHLTSQGFDPKQAGMSEFGSLAASFPGLFTLVYGVPVTNIWAYINEMSVGLPGLTGRQVSLTPANETDPAIGAALAAIESAASEGRITAVATRGLLEWRFEGGQWLPDRGPGLTTAALRELGATSNAPVTVTAMLPENMAAGGAARQPLLSVPGTPNLPVVNGSSLSFAVTGAHVDPAASVWVDGVRCPDCSLAVNGATTTITLDAAPTPNGIHVLQVHNPAAFSSNELPICVGASLNGC